MAARTTQKSWKKELKTLNVLTLDIQIPSFRVVQLSVFSSVMLVALHGISQWQRPPPAGKCILQYCKQMQRNMTKSLRHWHWNTPDSQRPHPATSRDLIIWLPTSCCQTPPDTHRGPVPMPKRVRAIMAAKRGNEHYIKLVVIVLCLVSIHLKQ